ncbi:MAG: CatB-related O-acetyltransferase [Algicola sp.]|nr:CatB-related O-acetyltransferase [Algicola sp.]
MISNLKSFFRKEFYKLFPELNALNSNSILNSEIDEQSKIYPPSVVKNVKIGNYTYVSYNSKISNTVIGKFCSIGPNFIAGWGIHPTHGISTHPMFYSTKKQNGMTLSTDNKFKEQAPIKIGNDVFIGMNTIVLDGVEIGDGAIIGAGAVVTKDIPPYAIAVGNPIKVIKYRFEDPTIDNILKIKWWEKEETLQDVERHFFEVEKFIQTYLND